jgi:hypothetical protein
MRICLGRSHGLLAGFAITARLADAAGIAMFPQGYLADRGLPSNCEATLYQSVNCPAEAGDLMSYGYIDDPAVNKLVCRQVCGSSIGHMSTKVASACGAAELTPGIPFVTLVDKLWSSWNQSCFTDPKTGDYCQGSFFSSISLMSSFQFFQLSLPRFQMSSRSLNSPSQICVLIAMLSSM